jgi:hypothetical protein
MERMLLGFGQEAQEEEEEEQLIADQIMLKEVMEDILAAEGVAADGQLTVLIQEQEATEVTEE